MSSIISLFALATNSFVRHVNLLAAYSGAIPPVLYEFLLKASMKTERILSVRHLFLCWPLKKLSLVNCKEFKEEHTLVLAHGLQTGSNKLREIDLTGCNIGVRGTKFLLMLVAGQPLPNVTRYCPNRKRTNKNTAAEHSIEKSKDQQNRLSITTNCYVDNENYYLLLEVLESGDMLHNFTVSYFHAIALGRKRIEIVIRRLAKFQAEGVTGMNVEMNNLHLVSDNGHQCFSRFSNLQYLNLSMNKIGPIKIHQLLKNISAPLTHLILNNCQFMIGSGEWGTKMATFPSIQKLEHLEIENNQLREIGRGIIILLLRCSKTLLFLSLEKNYLTDKSVPEILQLLAAPFALKTLRIGENKFSLESERLFFSKDKLGRIDGYSNEVQ